MTSRTRVNVHRFDSGLIHVASRFSMLVSFIRRVLSPLS
jgi:hypothetical protein